MTLSGQFNPSFWASRNVGQKSPVYTRCIGHHHHREGGFSDGPWWPWRFSCWVLKTPCWLMSAGIILAVTSQYIGDCHDPWWESGNPVLETFEHCPAAEQVYFFCLTLFVDIPLHSQAAMSWEFLVGLSRKKAASSVEMTPVLCQLDRSCFCWLGGS